MIDQLENRRGIRHLIYYHTVRARRNNRTTGYFCPTDWLRCCAWFGYRCAYCGADAPLTMDHFLPLSGEGSGNTVWNVVPACEPCNKKKRSKNPYQWLRKRFGEARAADIAGRIECYFDHAETRSGK